MEDTMKLWLKILIGLILGVIAGAILGEKATIFKPLGDLFINAIKMLIVPLIFSSLFVGVTSMNDPQKMGRIGLKSIGLYLITTAIAISLGLLMAHLIPAGLDMNLQVPQSMAEKEVPSITQTLINITPKKYIF